VVEVLAPTAAAAGTLDASAGAEGTPLHAAAAAGHDRALSALLAAGADPDVTVASSQATPLHLAVAAGHAGAVAALLEGGADADALNAQGSAPLHLAASKGNMPVLNALIGVWGGGSTGCGLKALPLLDLVHKCEHTLDPATVH
jgi:ankyrin